MDAHTTYADTRALSDKLRLEVESRQRSGHRSHCFNLLGTGIREITRGLERLERDTQRSVWNMQPLLHFDPEAPSYAMAERSRRRDVELRLIVNDLTLVLNPLLTSVQPNLRVAPIWLQAMVVDERLAVIEGRRGDSGEPSAWVTTEDSLVRLVLDLWQATNDCSTTAPTQQCLTRRQVLVARALCLGTTDSRIAKQLDVSVRSVERDVGVLLEHLHATSRTEAVLNMLGRGTNSHASCESVRRRARHAESGVPAADGSQ